MATKRSINFMVLSFAQDLLLRFSDRNFAAMVRESGEAPARPAQLNFVLNWFEELERLAPTEN